MEKQIDWAAHAAKVAAQKLRAKLTEYGYLWDIGLSSTILIYDDGKDVDVSVFYVASMMGAGETKYTVTVSTSDNAYTFSVVDTESGDTHRLERV